MQKKLFMTANEVANCMSVSVPMAYKIIKQLNEEQEASGYLTIAGRVNAKYFESKIFGGISDESKEVCQLIRKRIVIFGMFNFL